MDNKKKMKAMIKQMQSVIALVIIFVVASIHPPYFVAL